MKNIFEMISHFFWCDGPAVAEGFVLDPKNNHGPTVLRGWRRIHKCDTCGELYAHDPDDLIQPHVTLKEK